MQQLQGQFPEVTDSGFGPPGTLFVVLGDNIAAATGWSTGAQSIIVLNSQPSITRPWTIYGFGIQGQGAIGGGGGPRYGLLGKLYAALLFGGSWAPQNNAPFSLPAANASPNLIPLWDGSVEPPFPALPALVMPLPPGGYFQGSLQLPIPQKLSPGDQLAVALWLTPSLTNKCETMIRHATWTILYST